MPTRFERDFQYAKEDVKLPSKVAELDIFGLKDKKPWPRVDVRAKNPEGREVIFDFEKERERWLDFYKKHNIKVDIPEIKLTQEQQQEFEKCIKEFCFNKVLIIPENLPSYKELNQKMTKHHVHEASGGNFRADGSDDGVEDLRKGARIIFTKDVQSTIKDDFFKQTVNLPPEDPNADNDLKGFIKKIKNEKGVELEGLTFSEYLIYQKEYSERNKKYLDADGCTWLTGSKMKRSAHALYVKWVKARYKMYGDGWYEIMTCLSSDYSSFIGCRLAKSFELKK